MKAEAWDAAIGGKEEGVTPPSSLSRDAAIGGKEEGVTPPSSLSNIFEKFRPRRQLFRILLVGKSNYLEN